MQPLPIEAVLPALQHALHRSTGVVLQAPPGAGKTTLVPLALRDEPWLGGQRIVMLEPRRLAARAAAHRMAALLGESVGETVGHRMRNDTRVGARTRIEVVTEGVLTRMLQHDPSLERVGMLIFDEFHERSLHADVGLALALEARAVLRPELRLLVMSATLDTAPVAALLEDAPVLTTEGRTHPVELRYLDRPLESDPAAAAARAAARALARHEGDVLVFLPGAAEILRAHETLRAAGAAADVYPLHGSLPFAEQDRAIVPSPPGRRKVVLATSIAETSLTIEGVTVVVDAGLMRLPRFSPRTGMTRLETVRVTRAAADQRAGRAGRLAPGTCYRLWTEPETAALLGHTTPEILEADLAPVALDLAAWGVTDPRELRWLDAPPAAAFAQAGELLRELGALDAAGRVTAHGQALAQLPAHPRIAHMLLRGAALGHARVACELAALLEERDLLRRGDGPADPDLRLRIDALRTGRGDVDRGVLGRVRRETEQWERRLRRRFPDGFRSEDAEAAGLLLAFAYPDRIAQRRAGAHDRVLLRNGRGARLASAGALSACDYLVAAQLEDRGAESRVFLAAPLERAELERHFGADTVRARLIELDEQSGAVRARQQRRLGAIVLEETQANAAPGEAAPVLAAEVRRGGLAVLEWSREAAQLRQRLALLHALQPEAWPDVSDARLLETLEDWLLPHAPAATKLAELKRVPLAEALLTGLGWEARRRLDELAPSHWTVPSGSRIPIDYSDPAAPVLAVRLQEMFGATETPCIAAGRMPLTLHLLSPAQRPVQVTRDLASFWRTTYFEVRRDLKGRYPKHYWPDDPLVAEPTRRAKPRPH